AALCNINRHQAGEKQTHAKSLAGRSAIRDRRKFAENRAPLHPPENKKDRSDRRCTERNRKKTSRQAAQRTAGPVNHVWEVPVWRNACVGTGASPVRAEQSPAVHD